MNEKLKKRNPYPLKIEGQGSCSVEDTFLLATNMLVMWVGGISSVFHFIIHIIKNMIIVERKIL